MDSEPYTNEFGTTTWYNRAGQRHREDGPAVEYDDGSEEWYIQGVLHRVDGPAVYSADGFTAWYQQGQLHRENGPARQWAFDGDDEWWHHGERIEAPRPGQAERANTPAPLPHQIGDVVSRASRAQVSDDGTRRAIVAESNVRSWLSDARSARIDWGR